MHISYLLCCRSCAVRQWGSARSGFAHTCSSFPLASLAGPSRYQARVLRPSRCRPHCLTAADSKRLSRRVSGATKSAAVRTTGVAGVTQTLLYKKRVRTISCSDSRRTAATYSPTWCGSTIGVSGLNFSVRNGKRWFPAAKATAVYCLKEITRLRKDLGLLVLVD